MSEPAVVAERMPSTFTDSDAETSSHKFRTTPSFLERVVASLRRGRRVGRDIFADLADPAEVYIGWRARS